MSQTKTVKWAHACATNAYDEVPSQSFNLSFLHSQASKYEIQIKVSIKNTSSSAISNPKINVSFISDIGSDQVCAVTYSGTLNAGATQTFSPTITISNASSASQAFDGAIRVNNYATATTGIGILSKPYLLKVTRTYIITVPSTNDKLTISGLKQLATWCRMVEATPTLSTPTIKQADSGHLWGNNSSMINESGSAVSNSSTASQNTIIYQTTVDDTISACDNRSWSL